MDKGLLQNQMEQVALQLFLSVFERSKNRKIKGA